MGDMFSGIEYKKRILLHKNLGASFLWGSDVKYLENMLQRPCFNSFFSKPLISPFDDFFSPCGQPSLNNGTSDN